MRKLALIAALGFGTSLSSFQPSAVPVVYAHPLWAGNTLANPVIDATYDKVPTIDTSAIYGDGSWKAEAIANVDVPGEGIFIDPDEVLTATGFSNDPSYAGIRKVVIIFAGGTPVEIPGALFALSPRGIPGWQFKLSGGGKAGLGNLTIIVYPVNGKAKIMTRQVVVDDLGLLNAPTAYVDPNATNGDTTGVVGDRTKPFQHINKALASAPGGAKIKLLAGYHDLAVAAANPKNNVMMYRVMADDGLGPDTVKVGAPNAPVGGSTLVVCGCSSVIFDSVTFETQSIGTFKVYANVQGVSGAGFWRRSNVVDTRGFAGATYDPNNNLTDPDEVATPGSGGFGIGPGESFLTFMYVADGSRWGFMESTATTIGLRNDCFRRNLKGKFGFDANIIGSLTSTTRKNQDGTAKNVYDDLFMCNVNQNMASTTALKGRLHDVYTLRVVSKDYSFQGSTAFTAGVSGTAASGIAIFSVDTNQRNAANPTAADTPGPVPALQVRSFGSSVDDTCRFLTGTLQPTPMNGGTNTYGWRLIAQGGGTVVVGGQTITLAANQIAVSCDPTKVSVLDLLIVFNAGHTDTFQYGGQDPYDLPVPNRRNHTFVNVRSIGPGAGNMILIQSSTKQWLSKYYTFNADGTWSLGYQGTVKAIATAAISVTAPTTDTYDGVKLAVGDRLGLMKQGAGNTAVTNGIWIFQGIGNAMTRASDTINYGETWLVLGGAIYGGLMLSVSTSATQAAFPAITVGTTAVQMNTSKTMPDDCIQITDASAPAAQFWQRAFIETVSADGLSGTLSRPFVAADGVTPITIAPGLLIPRSKSIVSMVMVNFAIYATNKGQIGPGARNMGFWGSTFVPGADTNANGYDSAIQIRTDGFGVFQDITFGDCYLGSGLAIPDMNTLNKVLTLTYDPRVDVHVVNCATRERGSVPARFGGNITDGSTNVITGANAAGNQLGVLTAAFDATSTDTAFTLSGLTSVVGAPIGGARVMHPQLAYDVFGKPRKATSPVGALA